MDFLQQGYLGKNDWWRYLVGTLFIFFLWQFLGVIPLVYVAYKHAGNLKTLLASAEVQFSNLGIDNNLMLGLMLLTGVFGVIAIIIALRIFHNRSFKTVLTARQKFDWKRVAMGFTITAIVALIGFYLTIQQADENLVWNFNPEKFYPLLLVSFVLFPFQTGTEEFLFRGYLMQWFGTGLNSRLAALLITGVLFGIVHGANPEVAKLGSSVMIFYIGTGLFYGLTTLLDDGLELSFGMHTANNISAALLISTDWTIIHTDALYIDYSEPSVDATMLIPVLIGYPLLTLFFAKIYHWNDWKTKLFSPLNEPKTASLNETNNS